MTLAYAGVSYIIRRVSQGTDVPPLSVDRMQFKLHISARSDPAVVRAPPSHCVKLAATSSAEKSPRRERTVVLF